MVGLSITKHVRSRIAPNPRLKSGEQEGQQGSRPRGVGVRQGAAWLWAQRRLMTQPGEGCGGMGWFLNEDGPHDGQ